MEYIEEALILEQHKKETGKSERELAHILDMSKSDVHRLLRIARLPRRIHKLAKKMELDKWTLVEFSKINDEELQKEVEGCLKHGLIRTRKQIRAYIADM